MTSAKRWGPIPIWRSRMFSTNTKISLTPPLPWSFIAFITLDVRGKARCSKEPKAAFSVTVLLSANGNPGLQTCSLPRWCPDPVWSITAGIEAGAGPVAWCTAWRATNACDGATSELLLALRTHLTAQGLSAGTNPTVVSMARERVPFTCNERVDC